MNLLPFHMALMALAVTFKLGAIGIARFLKNKKWWLKAHKAMNLSSVGAALAGFLVAAAMVQSTGGPHFRVFHAVLGGATLCVAATMPFFGYKIFRIKGKEKIAKLRTAHKNLGRFTLVLLGGSALAGLLLAGII
jgi:hypothetical protein